MQISILIPCCGNFAMEGFSDWLPKQFTSIDSIQAAALHAAQGWAGALTIMALAALVRLKHNLCSVWLNSMSVGSILVTC